MYRIELAPGEETVFRTIEELAVGMRNGVVTPRARIYHNASQKWLPIGLHPHYKKALATAGRESPAPAPVHRRRRPRRRHVRSAVAPSHPKAQSSPAHPRADAAVGAHAPDVGARVPGAESVSRSRRRCAGRRPEARPTEGRARLRCRAFRRAGHDSRTRRSRRCRRRCCRSILAGDTFTGASTRLHRQAPVRHTARPRTQLSHAPLRCTPSSCAGAAWAAGTALRHACAGHRMHAAIGMRHAPHAAGTPADSPSAPARRRRHRHASAAGAHRASHRARSRRAASRTDRWSIGRPRTGVRPDRRAAELPRPTARRARSYEGWRPAPAAGRGGGAGRWVPISSSTATPSASVDPAAAPAVEAVDKHRSLRVAPPRGEPSAGRPGSDQGARAVTASTSAPARVSMTPGPAFAGSVPARPGADSARDAEGRHPSHRSGSRHRPAEPYRAGARSMRDGVPGLPPESLVPTAREPSDTLAMKRILRALNGTKPVEAASYAVSPRVTHPTAVSPTSSQYPVS